MLRLSSLPEEFGHIQAFRQAFVEHSGAERDVSPEGAGFPTLAWEWTCWHRR
jgi:hypothetical protein